MACSTPTGCSDQLPVPRRQSFNSYHYVRESETPVKEAKQKNIDVSTLLPPIDKHTSVTGLDLIDDSVDSGAYRKQESERRHSFCGKINKPKRSSVSSEKTKSRNVNKSEIVSLNCSGELYQIRRKLLVKYPNTLLGSEELERYYRPDLSCYFFDRNRQFFEHIVQFYLCGRLNIHNDFDFGVAVSELTYFRINDDEAAAETTSCSLTCSVSSGPSVDGAHQGCVTAFQQFRAYLYIFLNNPRSSGLAIAYCITDVSLVLSAMLLMMFETDTHILPSAHVQGSPSHRMIHISDTVFMIFFSIDISLRIISWPTHHNCNYFTEPMNILDVIAVTPYYVESIVNLAALPAQVDVVAVLRATRLLRMVRIFRFVRHSEELFRIIRFVYETRNQLCIIYLFSQIIILIFGSAMYYAEGGPQFESILSSCWWSLVTLSTLGYGDKIPQTFWGCVIGSLAVMVGMVVLSLPMTIVVSKFAEWHENEKRNIEANRMRFRTVQPMSKSTKSFSESHCDGKPQSPKSNYST